MHRSLAQAQPKPASKPLSPTHCPYELESPSWSRLQRQLITSDLAVLMTYKRHETPARVLTSLPLSALYFSGGHSPPRSLTSLPLCTPFLLVDICSSDVTFWSTTGMFPQELVSSPKPPCGTCPFAQRAACNSLPLRALASLSVLCIILLFSLIMYQTFLEKKNQSSSQPSWARCRQP
jgi:hypothetical protein